MTGRVVQPRAAVPNVDWDSINDAILYHEKHYDEHSLSAGVPQNHLSLSAGMKHHGCLVDGVICPYCKKYTGECRCLF